MIQRFWCIVVFCVLTGEDAACWGGLWSTPWRFVEAVLFAPIPGVRLPWFDAIVVLLLIFAKRSVRDYAKPAVWATVISLAALLLWAAYGALRGGSVFDMRLQLHMVVMTWVAALMQVRLLRTRAHFWMLGRAIVFAGVYRAATMTLFYWLVMRSLGRELATVTRHGDSMLYVTAVVIVLAHALHERRRSATVRAVLLMALMLWCIYLNNRRLAYVSLVSSGVVVVILSWNSALKSRLVRGAKWMVPVMALYLAVGWRHPTGMFAPIQTLQSVRDPNDPSTRSRIVENVGLVTTIRANPLLGTGFGQRYVEVSDEFSRGFVKTFPQYRYLPHNSVLGFAAFMGILGFAAYWMVLPIVVYLSGRAYTGARTSLDRTIAMTAACEVIIYANQAWGDLGVHASPAAVLASGAVAAAARVSAFAEVGRKDNGIRCFQEATRSNRNRSVRGEL